MKDIKDMSFEEAMDILKQLLEKMETAQLPLEEAVDAYERSTALKKHCEEKLKQAQLRVEKIMNNNGSQAEPLDDV